MRVAIVVPMLRPSASARRGRSPLLLRMLRPSASARRGRRPLLLRMLRPSASARRGRSPLLLIPLLALGVAARADDAATARDLEQRRLPVSAFFFYGEALRHANAGPEAAQAAAGVQRISEALRDEVFGPNLLAKLDAATIASLPSDVASHVHAALALFQYRAGKLEDAQREATAVAKDSEAFPQAQYVAGLLAQRSAPETAIPFFNGVLSDRRSSKELRELSHLALARTLYGLRRYPEAAAEYAKLPRFSRHWDEGLFEGAYADLMRGDPGSAL